MKALTKPEALSLYMLHLSGHDMLDPTTGKLDNAKCQPYLDKIRKADAALKKDLTKDTAE